MDSQLALQPGQSSLSPELLFVRTPTRLSPEEPLILRLLADPDTWYGFVHQYQPLIANVVIKTLRRCIRPNPALVDDLVQETFLKLCANDFKALREFDHRHEYALAGFLKVVASNVTQDYLRSILCPKRGSGKGEDFFEETVPRADLTANFADAAEKAVILGQIERCLEQLRSEPNFERDSRIFWLYYEHGLTACEIARCPEIALTVKGVESALFRLTRFLRTRLGGRQKPESQPVRTSVSS
jgi:RNA polymerase sigma-70 factor, ECF subfamily